MLKMKEILWKYNLNSVKDVPMLYAYFMMIEIIVSEKKMRQYFRTTPHIYFKRKSQKKRTDNTIHLQVRCEKAGQGSLTT